MLVSRRLERVLCLLIRPVKVEPPVPQFRTYWQPSLFKFDPLDSTTIVAGAIGSGVFVSLDNGSSWQTVSNNISPTSATPGIPAPIFAYFSPGRFNASTNAFDVWVGTRGAGVHKVVLERPAPIQ